MQGRAGDGTINLRSWGNQEGWPGELVFSKGWEVDRVNLAAFQFRKGHGRQMRKEGTSLLDLLPLSGAIKVMDDDFGR